jgi:hypothetical protein
MALETVRADAHVNVVDIHMEALMACGSFSGAADHAPGVAARKPRKALEIVGIVFGFFYFWPAAAAYVAWKMLGYPVPAQWRETIERNVASFGGFKPFAGGSWPSGGAWQSAGTGNRAFDDYRRAEIERLENERRRLDDEARDFRAFVDDLKRAKDREEFDAYMAKRRAA